MEASIDVGPRDSVFIRDGVGARYANQSYLNRPFNFLVQEIWKPHATLLMPALMVQSASNIRESRRSFATVPVQ